MGEAYTYELMRIAQQLGVVDVKVYIYDLEGNNIGDFSVGADEEIPLLRRTKMDMENIDRNINIEVEAAVEAINAARRRISRTRRGFEPMTESEISDLVRHYAAGAGIQKGGQ